MDIAAVNVAMIAEGLKVRKKLQGPTLLFLGARAGTLFRSKTLYDELRPPGQRHFTPLNPIESFRDCIRLLEREQFSETEIHYILLRALQDAFIQDLDRYVAALVRLNFFQLIVTTNIDAGLEAAMSRIGLEVKRDFDVFIPGLRSSSSLPSVNKDDFSNRPTTLIKLYGELAIDHYSVKRRDKFLTSDTQVYQQLQEMHNWNTLMVGFDPLWDAAVVPLLFPCMGKLWYVNEETPSSNSLLAQSLQRSKAQCLLGPKGESEKFCQSLYQHIVGSAPLPSLEPAVESPFPKPRRLSLSPPISRGEPARASAKSLLPTQYRIDVLLIATTKREFTALLKQHYGTRTPHTIQGRTCYSLGHVGDASVFLTQADEGEITPDTLGEQIQELSPAYILLLGTALGFKYKGQYIGNLLVPDRILIYDVKLESQTPIITTTDLGSSAYIIQERKDHYGVPIPLLNLFKNGSIIQNKKTKRLVSVTFGPLFASITAIDTKTAFRYVSKAAPDAVGIETGDAKLFSLAKSYQENCLPIKVVSALVDADEATNQDMPDSERGLENAAQFILDIIALGGFHDPKRYNVLPI